MASSEGRRPDVSEQEEGGVDAPESLEVAGEAAQGDRPDGWSWFRFKN